MRAGRARIRKQRIDAGFCPHGLWGGQTIMNNQPEPLIDMNRRRAIVIGIAVVAVAIMTAICPVGQVKQPSPAATSTPTMCERVNTETWSIRCSTRRSPDGKYIVNHWSMHNGPEVIDVLTADDLREVYSSGDLFMSSGGCWPEDWQPDGSLFFRCYLQDTSAVHRLDPATGKTSIVCTGGTPVFQSDNIRWSPDGQRIAMVVESTFSSRALYAVNKDGSHLVFLAEVNDQSPVDWSPDGKRIVYSKGYQTSMVNIVDSDGAHPRDLAEGYRPRWSPDGRTIAFLREDGLYRIDPNGLNLAPIYQASVRSFAWSPDGKTIAFEREDGLYRIDLDGSNLALLFKGDASSYAWSPDGSRIAAKTPDTYTQPGRTFILPAGGPAAEQPVMISDQAYVDGGLVWSPDGQQLAFAGRIKGGDRSIYVVDRDGKNLRQLADDAYDRPPLWASDGRHLVFFRRSGGGPSTGVAVMNLDDGAILDLPYKVYGQLAISSDGQTLAMITLIRGTSSEDLDKEHIYLGNIDGRPPVDLTEQLAPQFRHPCRPRP